MITSNFPIPGFGVVPINAFVLHGSEPVLVDTGAAVERDEFMTALPSPHAGSFWTQNNGGSGPSPKHIVGVLPLSRSSTMPGQPSPYGTCRQS